jgi:hypothetical protein
MNENKKGYWIYSVVAVTVGMGLFAFLGWLIYDLIIKLSEKDFTNNTVIQALITLIITVFVGGYFSKWLENKNAKKMELYKIQTSLSLKIIDLASAYLHNSEDSVIKNALICESCKVKLYFPDDVLKALNNLILDDNKESQYDILMEELRKSIK